MKLYINDGDGPGANPFDSIPAELVSTASRVALSIATGLLNPDLRQDFVIGAASDQNLWYRNLGSVGPYAGGSVFNVTADTAVTLAIAIGDLNGDSSPDIIAGNPAMFDNAARNKLYLNDRSSQPFAAGTGIDINNSPENTQGIAIGDIDNDGDNDVVFANGFGPALSTFFENNGTFAPFSGVPGRALNPGAAIDSHSVALGDVDGDTDLDVILGNVDAPSQLYLNDYTSLLTNTAIVTITIDDANEAPVVNDQTFNIDENEPMGTPLSPGGVIIATDPDLPGDMLNYAIIADNSGGAFKVDPMTGAITVEDMSKLDYESDTSFELTVEVTDGGGGELFSPGGSFDLSPEAGNTQAILLHDMNDDGLLDVVVGNYNQQNLYIKNNGTPNPFAGSPVIAVSADFDSTRSIALGDLNGNNAPDLVFGNDAGPNRLVLNNATDDPFDGATPLSITLDPSTTLSIGAADLDSDGFIDVLSGNDGSRNRYYVNNGTINPFAAVIGQNADQAGLETRFIQLADMDGDTHIDIVEAVNNSPVQLRLNNRAGAGFDPFDMVNNSDIGVGMISAKAILVGDANNDLEPDVIVATSDGAGGVRNLLFLNNDEPPGFDPFLGVMGLEITADQHESVALALGDVNSDGLPDLVVGNIGTGAGQVNRLYLNTGNANPFDGPGIDITSDSHETTSVAVGDVNGDNRPDIIVGNQNQRNRLYLNNLKSDTATITININNINDRPEAADPQSFVIDENHGEGLPPGTAFVGKVLATDDDTEPVQDLTYAFNPSVHPAFQIDSHDRRHHGQGLDGTGFRNDADEPIHDHRRHHRRRHDIRRGRRLRSHPAPGLSAATGRTDAQHHRHRHTQRRE